uniref:Protein NDNF n=1 Tax=Oryzias latipes TaxID=8090 RepID=A0A3P9KP79_ORYLA
FVCRLYFTLKKASGMSVTVSPCDVPIEWSLSSRTLKDKPFKSLHWSTKKSKPEVWWRGPGTEEKLHSFTGKAVDTYSGPSHPSASLYILRLRCKQQNTRTAVYFHKGMGPSGMFPLLPADSRLHTLGVGMTSVTLSWAPSASITSLAHVDNGYDYCVLVNSDQNYPSLCAAQKSIRKEQEEKEEKMERGRRVTVWPILKEWWWQQWDTYAEVQSSISDPGDEYADLQCVCQGTETVCTVSELLPDTPYYFDVFVIDRVNGTSAAYKGTSAQTHGEARPPITPLKDGELRWVTFRDRGSNSQYFSFRPRGWQQSGLLTLQSCDKNVKIMVSVSIKGKVLTSQGVGVDLVHIWLQGKQALGVPSLPSTLQIKSFNRLRGCNSVTIAWMGTEERSLYCVYRRKVGNGEAKTVDVLSFPAPCLGPESRSDTERVLCKYFQELNPRRAVTTAVIGGLEPGTAYVFDVYLMRRWGIPIKYKSKMVKTRNEC